MSDDLPYLSEEQLTHRPLAYATDLFAGRTLVISGAGRGIGKAIAFTAVRLGARVALCGRNEERLAATAETLRDLGGEVFAKAITIRDPEAVRGFLGEVEETFGGFDALINNAGGQFPQAAIDYSDKGWNAVIDTNLNGTWYMMQGAARVWQQAARAGAIVNIVAVVSRGLPGVAHTCAARAGVIGLSRSVAIEWAPLDIRVNCIAPGIIATEGMEVYPDEARNDMPNSNLLRRFGDAGDVADAVVYLLGPTGGFITGEVLTLDGGNQLWGDQWTIPKPDFFKVN